LESVKAFGASVKFTQRQTFLIMCQSLMNNKDNKLIFQSNFMSILIELADDKVINVRLVLAEIIQRHFLAKGALYEEADFLTLKNKLENEQNE
jgi:hypothetical protein